MSYAEMAAKGPKQTPAEAAAPALPEIESADSASTISLIDVDTPSVRTVPSEFGADSAITTTTQAQRLEREAALADAKAAAKASAKAASSQGKKTSSPTARAGQAAARARARTGDSAKKAAAEAAAQARRADRWITDQFSSLQQEHPGATQAAIVGNVAAVAGLGALLSVRAWGLVEQGRFSWKTGALGLGVVGAIGLVEGALASYFYKTKPQKK